MILQLSASFLFLNLNVANGLDNVYTYIKVVCHLVMSQKYSNVIMSSPFDQFDFFVTACIPAKCGRAIVDQLFSEEESHRLLSIAKKGLVKGGSNGGASILDLHSGALSKVR